MSLTRAQAWVSGHSYTQNRAQALGSAPAAGNVVIAVCGTLDTADAIAAPYLTDDFGDTVGGTAWTEFTGSSFIYTNGNHNVHFFWRQVGTNPNGTGKTITCNAGASADNITAACEYHSSVSGTFSENGTPSHTADAYSATPATGTITTTIADAIVVAAELEGSTATNAGSYTDQGSVAADANNYFYADLIATSAGGYSNSWSTTTTSWSAGQVALAFTPAGAGHNVTHAAAFRNAVADLVTSTLGSGAKLKLRLTGTADAPGTVVAALSFSSTPFGSATGGVITANAITSDTNATGNATAPSTATFEKSDGTVVVHMTVAASGADLALSGGTTIRAGDTVSCSSLTYTAIP